MNEEHLIDLFSRLESEFSGPTGIIGEGLLPFIRHENDLERKNIAKYQKFVAIQDCFFDFYLTSMKKIIEPSARWSFEIKCVVTIHLVNLWRFRASNVIFLKGYYIDASSLLRAVYENNLTLSAIGNHTISFNELFIDPEKAGPGNAQSTKRKKLKDHFDVLDRKINENIVGNRSNLSADTIEMLRLFKFQLHNSVHKSNNNLAEISLPWLINGTPPSIFPEHNERLAANYYNNAIYLAWISVRTLGLLPFVQDEFDDKWQNKYRILDDTLQSVIDVTQPMGRAIRELISKKFTFLHEHNSK